MLSPNLQTTYLPLFWAVLRLAHNSLGQKFWKIVQGSATLYAQSCGKWTCKFVWGSNTAFPPADCEEPDEAIWPPENGIYSSIREKAVLPMRKFHHAILHKSACHFNSVVKLAEFVNPTLLNKCIKHLHPGFALLDYQIFLQDYQIFRENWETTEDVLSTFKTLTYKIDSLKCSVPQVTWLQL